mgnify:CR=1 FL=1
MIRSGTPFLQHSCQQFTLHLENLCQITGLSETLDTAWESRFFKKSATFGTFFRTAKKSDFWRFLMICVRLFVRLFYDSRFL